MRGKTTQFFSALEPIWYRYQILTHNGVFGQLNL